MRIDKYLCDCGIDTRSNIKKNIKHGLVTVNNQIVTDASLHVSIDDEICFAHQKIMYQEYEYYMLYKPASCVCAAQDKNHLTIFHYLPQNDKQNLFCIGRLDIDTEGLLIITNDGDFSHQLLHPKKHVSKTYYVEYSGVLTSEALQIWESGMDIGEKKLLHPAKAVFTDNLKNHPCSEGACLLTISEGKFHQIKRMLHGVSCEVLYLKRLSMGSFQLDEQLKATQYRPFCEEELNEVKKYKSCHF